MGIEGETMTKRNTAKYHFKDGNFIVHTGITTDLERREADHQRESGVDSGHITKVGRLTTPEAAKEWEREQRDAGKPTEGYRTRPRK